MPVPDGEQNSNVLFSKKHFAVFYVYIATHFHLRDCPSDQALTRDHLKDPHAFFFSLSDENSA